MSNHILVIDDDASVRDSICHLLQGEQFRPLSAPSGGDALKIVSIYPVDLILLDLNMPGENGWETYSRLTRLCPLVPVIIITARVNQIFPALAAGVGALMEKPLDFSRLLTTIRDLILEPDEIRISRLMGRKAQFHYISPAKISPAG